MRILMCRPDFYGVKYEINPWMKVEHKVNTAKAILQWETLYQNILQCGAKVDLVPPAPDWPDMVFTANAGLLYHGKIILSRFRYKERQGETPFFEKWFKDHDFEILNPSVENPHEPDFEGAGDALFSDGTLFAAYGFRTSQEFYKQAKYLNHKQIVYCELTDPYFYHLDTCFCPLNESQAIWYPPAFTSASQKRMSEHIELIAVNQEEAKRFACNAVVLKKQIILPTGCPIISEVLKSQGFSARHCDMDEYLKAGGACKCLTLRLDY